MQIQYPLLFGEEVLDARVIEKQSAFSRDETERVLEVNANGVHVQIAPPAKDCRLITATPEEITLLETAGYQLQAMS